MWSPSDMKNVREMIFYASLYLSVRVEYGGGKRLCVDMQMCACAHAAAIVAQHDPAEVMYDPCLFICL